MESASSGQLIASNLVFSEWSHSSEGRKMLSEKKARNWMWAGSSGFRCVADLFRPGDAAALMLFTGVFIIFAIVALVIYLVDRAGQWSIGWAGERAAPQCNWRAVGLTLAEDLSRKQFRRPRSETAQ